MGTYSNGSKNSEKDILDILISLPSKNLESKIALLEEGINKRCQKNNEILSSLFTEKSRLQDQIHRLRYIEPLSFRINIRQDFLRIKERISSRIAEEGLSSLKDLLELNERLLDLKGELELARFKARLIK